MSFYGLVEHTLGEILLLINPTRDDWGMRLHIIEDVRAAVQTVESLKGNLPSLTYYCTSLPFLICTCLLLRLLCTSLLQCSRTLWTKVSFQIK